MENPKWQEEVIQLKQILDQAPLEKKIKWGAEVYTFDGKNVVSCGGFTHFFTLWFYNGVFLKDPYKVLVNANEKKTKSLRQWRFDSKEEINAKKILEYVYEAIEIEKKGLKIKPSKFTPIQAGVLLQEALNSDISFQLAFGQLTPGKQKEYILYIDEAKQESTKNKRIEKIKPLVLAGKGLNDKYK